jgi:hypothetical protein
LDTAVFHPATLEKRLHKAVFLLQGGLGARMQDCAHNTRSSQSPNLVFWLFFKELFFGKSPSKREKKGNNGFAKP